MVLPLGLGPRTILGRKVGFFFFLQKFMRFSLAKHSLGRNDPCEVVRYCFQKVLIVFLESIWKTGRRTRFCVEVLSKFLRNEQKDREGPLFSLMVSY